MPDALQDLVRRSIGSLRVPRAASDTATLTAAVDAVLGQVLRSLLHDRQFQALEAAWRGLDFLVKRLPTGPRHMQAGKVNVPQLKIFVVNYGLTEFKTDLSAAASLDATALCQVLVEQTVNTPGAEPWGLIVADYTLQAAAIDLLAAGCLARMAAWAGAADRGRQSLARRLRVAGRLARPQRLADKPARQRGQSMGKSPQSGRGVLPRARREPLPATYALRP